MGAPMLAALRGAGFEAQGFDVQEKPEGWISSDPTLFALGLATLVVVVPGQREVEDLLFGNQNFVKAPNLERIIFCTTLSPRYLRALVARLPDHVSLIDASVYGTSVSAQTASLTFLLGCEVNELEPTERMFRAMGKTIHHVGPFSAGMQAKALDNLLTATHIAMARLVLDWADKTGIDQEIMFDVAKDAAYLNTVLANGSAAEFIQRISGNEDALATLVDDISTAMEIAPHGAKGALPGAIRDAVSRLAKAS